MAIWIRSQDKKLLSKIEVLRISREATYNGPGKTVKYKLEGLTSFGLDYYLGLYDTEERALEILAIIQIHIGMLAHNQMYKCTPGEQYNYETYTFEMPEK